MRPGRPASIAPPAPDVPVPLSVLLHQLIAHGVVITGDISIDPVLPTLEVTHVDWFYTEWPLSFMAAGDVTDTRGLRPHARQGA